MATSYDDFTEEILSEEILHDTVEFWKYTAENLREQIFQVLEDGVDPTNRFHQGPVVLTPGGSLKNTINACQGFSREDLNELYFDMPFDIETREKIMPKLEQLFGVADIVQGKLFGFIAAGKDTEVETTIEKYEKSLEGEALFLGKSPIQALNSRKYKASPNVPFGTLVDKKNQCWTVYGQIILLSKEDYNQGLYGFQWEFRKTDPGCTTLNCRVCNKPLRSYKPVKLSGKLIR